MNLEQTWDIVKALPIDDQFLLLQKLLDHVGVTPPDIEEGMLDDDEIAELVARGQIAKSEP